MTNSSLSNLKVFTAAAAAGIIIGCAARAVKFLVAEISRLATIGFNADHSNWWLLLLGVASIMLSALVVRKVVRLPLEHATGRIKTDLAKGISPLPRRLMVAPVGVNALTLGLGGSAGAEGPIAYTGAAIASRVATRFGLSHQQALVFLACGAGAGIAAIFKAPLGGMFFTLEVLAYPLAPAFVLLLAIMCLFAGLTAYAAGDFSPAMIFNAGAFDLKWYLPAIALGVICGLYSIYYSYCGKKTAGRLERISTPWKRNLVAGLSVGICLFMFPALYGEGYGVLQKVLNGDMSSITAGNFLGGLSGTTATVAALGGILLIKSFATYSTNSGGGVAGEFAPTIFAGGILGALFSIVATNIPGLNTVPAGVYIVLAMSAVMAGTIKAPLMAIFIVAEMTQAPTLLLPLCLTSGISYAIAKGKKFSKL